LVQIKRKQKSIQTRTNLLNLDELWDGKLIKSAAMEKKKKNQLNYIYEFLRYHLFFFNIYFKEKRATKKVKCS